MLYYTWALIDRSLCPNSLPCKYPCLIEGNPDIAGIGVCITNYPGTLTPLMLTPCQVRIATYIQTFCGTILLAFSTEDTAGVRGTIVVTSLALVATTCVFALQGQLSLHHAMIVKDLLSLTLLPMHVVESWRVHSPGLFAAQQVRFVMYIALSLWLAVKAPCLGTSPECNRCTRVVQWAIWIGNECSHWTRASSTAGAYFLGCLWLVQQIWTYGPFNYLRTVPALISDHNKDEWINYVRLNQRYLAKWRKENLRRNRSVWNLSRLWLWYNDDRWTSKVVNQKILDEVQSQNAPKGRMGRRWKDVRVALTVPRVQRALIGLIFATIWAVSTERTVLLNLTKEVNGWGYGQIASLILTVPSVAALLKMVIRSRRAPKVSFCFPANNAQDDVTDRTPQPTPTTLLPPGYSCGKRKVKDSVRYDRMCYFQGRTVLTGASNTPLNYRRRKKNG